MKATIWTYRQKKDILGWDIWFLLLLSFSDYFTGLKELNILLQIRKKKFGVVHITKINDHWKKIGKISCCPKKSVMWQQIVVV